MPNNISDINNLLDSLYLELFNLIEQHTECRINIERTNNSGQLLLAKTRYNQGSNAIGTAQIPTENSEDFKALCYVEKEENTENTVAGETKHLIRHKVEKSQGYVEPLHWFGALPPMTLRNAAEHFKRSVELVVEAANIQTELLAVMDRIDRLKQVKKQLVQ
ncbi:coiled-coil domain-containing protein 115 [Musca autumnalis]|uniref:coiled-coil domain-containing protein 115 n=1 Tax=Musca autumnalis TaxID=221902 RepID=UPI003CF1FF92